MKHVVALSGGKDSTAMALRLQETRPEVPWVFFCTPTGDELPEMEAHWGRLEEMLDGEIVRVTNRTLVDWIDHFDALPNWRQRWCTRLLKIEPCLAWLKENSPATLYVGLRFDEDTRKGIYSDDVECVFPLREWGWGIREVWGYLLKRGVTVPTRTDCAMCYGQRLGEWWSLWKDHPDKFLGIEDLEGRVGHTLRSGHRDSWPAALKDLRSEFEGGRRPKHAGQGTLFGEDDGPAGCRVCRL